MAKQNLNVTYQWCFTEKYVEGGPVNGLGFLPQFNSSYTINYCFFIKVFIL